MRIRTGHKPEDWTPNTPSYSGSIPSETRRTPALSSGRRSSVARLSVSDDGSGCKGTTERDRDVTGISEGELRRAYRLGPVARPCVCGGIVIADPTDPTEGVQEHQATPKHKAWRAWMEA